MGFSCGVAAWEWGGWMSMARLRSSAKERGIRVLVCLEIRVWRIRGLMVMKVPSAGWRLLVKSRQIARGGGVKELLGGGAGEEAEVAHHVGVIAVAGMEGDLGQGYSR